MKISSSSPLSSTSPSVKREPHPFLKPELTTQLGRLIAAQDSQAKLENRNAVRKIVELSGSWDSYLEFLLEKIKQFPDKTLVTTYLHLMSFYNFKKCFKSIHQNLDFDEKTKIMNHSILAFSFPLLSDEKKRSLKERKVSLIYTDDDIENALALMHFFLLDKINLSKKNYEIYLKLAANDEEGEAIKETCETWLIRHLDEFKVKELLTNIERYRLERLAGAILDRELKNNDSK